MGLREDMISDMDFMHNTYGMLYIVKAVITGIQINKQKKDSK